MQHINLVKKKVLFFVLLVAAPPAFGAESLFAKLVDASSKSDQRALANLLATETLSTSTITVEKNNSLKGGSMRHAVPAAELAAKLQGCVVKQWRDTGSQYGQAYILWNCPTKRLPDDECYFYSYRAAMLDTRFHPANLFVHEMPSWDSRCGQRLPPPPGR